MDPLEIIKRYYEPDSKAYYYVVNHSKMVAKKSLDIAKNAKHLNPDLKFIQEAAMLHDIGAFLTDAPEIGCFGNKPYICHTYLGREVLEKEGLPKHAIVCETHIGIAFTKEIIEKRNLPLPKRDIIPLSVEEKIISVADKFFSKTERYLFNPRTLDGVKKNILRFGTGRVEIFERWLKELNYED